MGILSLETCGLPPAVVLIVRTCSSGNGPGVTSENLSMPVHPLWIKSRRLIRLPCEESNIVVLTGTTPSIVIFNGDSFARSRRLFT